MALYFSLFAYEKIWIKLLLFLIYFLQNICPYSDWPKLLYVKMNTHTYLKEEARDQAGDVSIWRSCPIHVSVRLALADTGCT